MEGKNITYHYGKLLGKIKELYGTQGKFAEALGIGRVSLSQRLSNKLQFSQNEILKSCHLLMINLDELADYFFQEKEL